MSAKTLNETPQEPFLEGEPYDHDELCKKGRPRKLLAAAVLHDNKLWTGVRHTDIVSRMIQNGDINNCPQEEAKGFLCDTGLFARRPPAHAIAMDAGQLPEDYDEPVLFSDHLWDE